MTISRSMDFSRATASAICSSSSRLAEMPVRLMGFSLLLGSLLLGFGLQTGRANVGAPLHQLVGEHQLGLDEGQVAFDIEGEEAAALIPFARRSSSMRARWPS